MKYDSLEQALLDLESNGMLIRIREEVDPYLEMAAIHLKVFERNGPALLFENIKGTSYRAASNIFGTAERCEFLFRDNLAMVKKMIALKNDPSAILKKPLNFLSTGMSARKAIPRKESFSSSFNEIRISDLPLIHHWPMDGGAFITLPQVYSEDPDQPGVMKSNLGMYRIQLNGNNYELNKEIGLHYQIHRGIGVHQAKAIKKKEKLKVSIFIGGPPAHTFSAVMPLPEGISELTFAGILGGKRFRYAYDSNGNLISLDADFIITGEIENDLTKEEGPFGDHLGYYSLKHPFPVLKIAKVYAKKNAIWPFTVVGRPPQEDTGFGDMIHRMAGDAIQVEIPGVKEVHAVDAAGVHPLLLAVGSERYTPFLKDKFPQEILTQANHILGSGQLSLAKYLFIACDDNGRLKAGDEKEFIQYVLERIDFSRDLHFHTNISIDTLDYSGSALNRGSKVVFAAYGERKRDLCKGLSAEWQQFDFLKNPRLISDGIVAIESSSFVERESATKEAENICLRLMQYPKAYEGVAMIVLCDNASFTAANYPNFLWSVFTRSNPADDIYGVDSSTVKKHWGCKGPLMIDARIKPHHAPPLVLDSKVSESADKILNNYKF
jgi:4-hydroxy-3-polyprenylbenzoate decarboxylase